MKRVRETCEKGERNVKKVRETCEKGERNM